MQIESMICLSILAGTLVSVVWMHRFDIWCWWQGQKTARRQFPGPADAERRASYAKRVACNLSTVRYSIRGMRKYSSAAGRNLD